MTNKTILTLLAAAGLTMAAWAEVKTDIIPRPSELSLKSQQAIEFSAAPVVAVEADAAATARLIAYLNQVKPGWKTDAENTPAITFRLTEDVGGVGSPEGYRLTTDPAAGCVIEATGEAGLFYGLQSMLQLLDANGGNSMPQVEITDNPRFGYRGMMIDVSRNFYDKEFIKKQLDAMARMKLNTFHFHLTDGAGWRLEIDRYPRLTEYAAWRKGASWKDWVAEGKKYAESTDPEAKGGFYTKDDIRDILNYAAERHITVIPEIEMPSHSEEVTAAYPELSCTHNPDGEFDYCPGNEKTFEFLQNVLDEVMELFPSEYINIGGDEAPKTHWRTCELCAKRMKDEGLENVDQLQSYLVHRIEQYLNSKGRKLIGWDEIMEGGLAPNAAVVSWRGIDGGVRAASAGHKAVMAPGRYCYFDGYQDAPYSQPEAIGGYLPIELVYSFDPAPATLADSVADNIAGLEATLFTEYVPTPEHAEYMLYPRMTALAEVAWTPQELRGDYPDFRRRALAMNQRLKDEGYNVFDLSKEIGNRSEALAVKDHLGKGKKVEYVIDWWGNYPAAGAATLTDGIRGGWNYNDQRWQGFVSNTDDRIDVIVDLEKEETLRNIGADFMQLIGPDVWFPSKVVISVSADGKEFTPLRTIDTPQKPDEGVLFRTYGWQGETRGRYVRYQAYAPKGVLFIDEIVIE